MNTELGFKTDYARTELFRPSFPPRVGRLWNNLPISDAKFTSTAHATELLIEESYNSHHSREIMLSGSTIVTFEARAEHVTLCRFQSFRLRLIYLVKPPSPYSLTLA